MVPGGGGEPPTRLPSADFESAFSTVAGARKWAHVGRITSSSSVVCTVWRFCMASQTKALNTWAKYHQKYPRKTQRTCVPFPSNSGTFLDGSPPLRSSLLTSTGSKTTNIWPGVGPVILLVILFTQTPCVGAVAWLLEVRRYESDCRSSLSASSHRAKVKSASLMLPNR